MKDNEGDARLRVQTNTARSVLRAEGIHMKNKVQAELESLKKDYLDLEKTFHHEKECLLKMVSTFGLIVDMSPTYRDAYREIKQLLQEKSTLSVDAISQKTGTLRSSIFAEELKADRETGDNGEEQVPRIQLEEAYTVLDDIAATLTDDFYPVDDAAAMKVGSIRFGGSNGISPADFKKMPHFCWRI